MSTAGSSPRPPGASPRNPAGRRRGRRRSNPAVPPPDGSQGQASQGDAEQCEGYRRPGAADNRVAWIGQPWGSTRWSTPSFHAAWLTIAQ